jgi:CubicO group peptidase (beta-lactamase class C family)
MVGARFGIITAGILALSAIGAEAQTRPLSAADRAHIAAVENGLLPAVIVKGRPIPAASLADRMRQTKVPGVSIAFFDHGRIVWAKGYGLADVASGRPVTPETRFQAASISKPVTAIAALRLVEAGKLDLDQDVDARLKAWQAPASAFTAEQKVTLRRLLSHGAGLTVHGFMGYSRDQALPTAVQILNGASPANSAPVVVDAVPGTRFSYSGGGYVATQLLMTEATGEAFPEIMREQVLAPLGMTHSTYEQPLPDGLQAKAATGYGGDGKPVPGGWHVYPEMAPAGLWTTPSDLARVAIEIQKEQKGASHRLLSPKMAREMLTRQIGDWGLGFQLAGAGRDGTSRFGHGGDNVGFKGELEAFTTGSGQGVAILTNGDGGSQLISEILRAVARSYGWKAYQPEERTVVSVDPATLARYVGRYQIPGLTTLDVIQKDGALALLVPILSPDPQPLLAQSPTEFFNIATGVSIAFTDGPGGAPAKMAINGSYGHFEAKRAP